MGEKMKQLDTKVKFVEFVEKIPRCTNEETWELWKELARTIPPPPKVGFCADCTLDYQIAMKAERRCENPSIVFEADEDGFISGCLPKVVA
jgi:hypothetical protein